MAWLTDWAWRKQIDLPIPDANLTDFPNCIKIVADAEIGAGCLATGFDIRFTDSGGETLLKYERESFAVASGEATGIFWVKSDVSTGGTSIYVYWGNAAAADGEDAENVWDASFAAVYHMKDATTSTFLDSTVNDNDAAKPLGANQPQEAAAKIGMGQDFDGVDDYAVAADSPTLDITENLTLSGWVKPDDFDDGTITGISKPGVWEIRIYATASTIPGRLLAVVYHASGPTVLWPTGGDMAVGVWEYLTLVVEKGVNSRFYRNGTPAGTDATYAAEDINTNDNGFMFGTWDGYFDGLLDEIRFSSIARTAPWIAYEYANMNPADGGLTWGEEESAYTGTGAGTSTATGAMNISKSLLGSSVGTTVAAAILGFSIMFSGSATATTTSSGLLGKWVSLQSAQTDGSGEGGVGWDIGADELPSTSASGAFAKSGASANLQAYIGETGWDIGADEYSGAGGYTWWLTGSATAESGASATLYGAVVSLTGTANAYLTLSTGEYQTHSLTGTSATVCSPSAVLSGMVKFLGSGSSGASSASAGTLNLLRPLSASVSQDSFAQGRLYVFSLLGASGGTSSATGSLTLSWRLFGSSAGASGATATLAWGEVSLTGTSAGASSATAHLGLPVEMTGTSAGASTAKASLGGSLSSQSVIYVKMDGVWQAIGSGGSSSSSLGVWIVGTITVQTSSYTVLPGVEVVVCNSEEAMTVTCPAATGSGSYFTVKNINSGTVTLDGAGAETIDGDTTQSIAQWEALTVLDYTSGKWISI